jgi:hypothetical protein
MLIDTLFNTNPTESWLSLERHVNDGSPSGYEHAALPQCFRPRGGESTFLLPCVRCEGGTNTVLLSARPHKPIGTSPSIPIHPNIISRYGPVHIQRKLEVVPTSSARTVVVPGPSGRNAICLKLHFPDLLGRFPRPLDERRIVAALEVNRDLETQATNLPRFMNESIGMIWRPFIHHPEHQVGCIYRSLPRELSDDSGYQLVPTFALFSRDERNPNHPPLLHQIVGGSDTPDEIVWRDFLLPVVRAWASLVLEIGHLAEWNAQNVLFLLHSRQHPQIIFRDLQGTYRDLELRPPSLPRVKDNGYKTLSAGDVEMARLQRSYLFDFKLGQYVLRPLIDCISSLCDSKADLRRRVREVMHDEILPALPHDFFPSGRIWYGQAPGVNVKGPGFFVQRREPEFR